MSSGLYFGGDNSSLLITSESESLVFLGKATFTSRQGITGAGFGPLYDTTTGTTLFNFPQASIYNFTFTSSGKDVVYFVYAPYPYKFSIISITKSGSTDTLGVVSQPAGSTSFIPTVYAFAAATVAQTTGYGINVFKTDGTPAFTSADNILFASKIYSATGQDSSLRPYTATGGFTYGANSGSQTTARITYHAPVSSDGTSISKPIVYFPAPQTGVTPSFGFNRYLYELCAAYNPTSGNIELEWITPFFGAGIAANSVYNVPSLPFFAMVADGALYD